MKIRSSSTFTSLVSFSIMWIKKNLPFLFRFPCYLAQGMRNMVALASMISFEWLKKTWLYVLVTGSIWYFTLLVISFSVFNYTFSDWMSVFIPIVSTFSFCLFLAMKKNYAVFIAGEKWSHLIGHDIHLFISFVQSLNLSFLTVHF